MSRHDRSRAAREAAKTDYGTPREEYEKLDALFNFTIDLAAHERNHKHARYFSPKDNTFVQSWHGETGFLNPEYGRRIGDFLAKARHEAINERAIVVQLIPANVGTAWWRSLILGHKQNDAGRLVSSSWLDETQVLWLRWEGLITGIHVLPYRIEFDGAEDGAMFDNAVVIHASPNRAPPRSAKRQGTLTWGWPS